MIPNSVSSGFAGGFYGGDIAGQSLRSQALAGSSSSYSIKTTAANTPYSASFSAGFNTGAFTQAAMGLRQQAHGQPGMPGGADAGGVHGPQPQYITINQMMVRDIIMFLKNNAVVNACVSVIPQRLLSKDFIWMGRLAHVNPAVKKALNISWKQAGRDAFRSAVDIGLIMIKTREHDVLNEVPVVFNYALHTPQFIITENDEHKYRVIRNDTQQVVEDVDVNESTANGKVRAPAYLYLGIRPDTLAVAIGQE